MFDIFFDRGWRIERRLNYSWFARRETRLTRKPQYDYQQETHVPRFVIDSNVFSFFSLSFPTNKKRKLRDDKSKERKRERERERGSISKKMTSTSFSDEFSRWAGSLDDSGGIGNFYFDVRGVVEA